MASSTRRRKPREATIEGILDAAIACMRENGVAGINLQEIGRLVGMRAPSLYEYFPGRMGIYDALFGLGVARVSELLIPVMESDRYETPEEQFADLARTFIRFSDDNRELWQLIFERPVPGFEPSAENLEASFRLVSGGPAMLQRWVDRGLLAPADPLDDATWMLITILHGLTALRVSNEVGVPAAESRYLRLVPEMVATLTSRWAPVEQHVRAD